MTESRRLGLRIALPAIGVAVALLLAGCSSSGGASSTSAASKTNFGGVKLTVWNSIDYNPYEAQQKSFFEKCGKKLGITVDDQTINGDYASALLKAAGSKSLPGIVQLSTDVELPTLAAEGALANLHSLGVSTEGESSSVSSLGTYKGTLYGLPSNIENYAIFYDKVAFANAGISTPPATFADFVADAKKVTSSTEAGVAFSGQSGDGSVAAYFLPWILSAGGNPADPTNPGTIAAVNLYKQLVANGSLSKEFVDWGWNSTDQWTAGKAVITVDGPWELVDSSLKVKYATAPFPTLKAGQKPQVGLLGYAYGVSATLSSKEQQAAAALIQCRSSEANQVATAIAGGYIPALTAAQQAFVAKVPSAKSFVDAVPTAYNPAKLGTKWNTLQNVFAAALQDAATNGDSAEQALAKAAQAKGQ